MYIIHKHTNKTRINMCPYVSFPRKVMVCFVSGAFFYFFFGKIQQGTKHTTYKKTYDIKKRIFIFYLYQQEIRKTFCQRKKKKPTKKYKNKSFSI